MEFHPQRPFDRIDAHPRLHSLQVKSTPISYTVHTSSLRRPPPATSTQQFPTHASISFRPNALRETPAIFPSQVSILECDADNAVERHNRFHSPAVTASLTDADQHVWNGCHAEQRPASVSSSFAPCYVSLHSTSDSRSPPDHKSSTPSDFYDENAENINPNQEDSSIHPMLIKNKSCAMPDFRSANILCDSGVSDVPVPNEEDVLELESEEGEDDAGEGESQTSVLVPIAAPIPLPYNARSKEVLSSMISSPVPPLLATQSQSTLATDTRQWPGSVELPSSDSETRQSGHANLNLNLEYAGPPQYQEYDRVACSQTEVSKPLRIRSISPATFMALTEPILMAWWDD